MVKGRCIHTLIKSSEPIAAHELARALPEDVLIPWSTVYYDEVSSSMIL
jgi:hypothetical protein